MISSDVAEGEADAAGRPAGIGIEHRDDDRHVGAADRQDEQKAEQRTTAATIAQKAMTGCATTNHASAATSTMPKRALSGCWPGKDQRRAGHESLQLGEGDDRAGEGDGADRRARGPSRPGCPARSRRACRCRRPTAHEKAAVATQTAARPTRLWKAATSCGSAVIWMLSAIKVPMAPPITMPARIGPKLHDDAGEASVVADGDRPCRRCRSSCRRATVIGRGAGPRSAMMKQTEATR